MKWERVQTLASMAASARGRSGSAAACGASGWSVASWLGGSGCTRCVLGVGFSMESCGVFMFIPMARWYRRQVKLTTLQYHRGTIGIAGLARHSHGVALDSRNEGA